MFKIGDVVKVIRRGKSLDSGRLIGRIGRIIETYTNPDFCILDIAKPQPSGIYYDELELVPLLLTKIPSQTEADSFWSVSNSATIKGYDLKCTCGTDSLHGGGKHSDYCDKYVKDVRE